MCGINVIFDPARAVNDAPLLIRSMNAQMTYRGPDSEGFYAQGPLTMGMRRLGIIDPQGGQQPLFNEDRSLTLVCNGEIYNHPELREALTRRGHTFATASDCEPILHLYEELGPECLGQLRGMFAFALWDSRRQRLFAARDRLGIKPLYVHRQGQRLALSSELKALTRSGLASAEPDPGVLADTLRFTFPITERRTLARAVERLAPGHYLLAEEREVRVERYWRPSPSASAVGEESIIETLRDAVRSHLRSDVPLAVLLSGGIDSAAIAALAHSAGSETVALCAGYRGAPATDERAEARRTAQLIGLPFVELELDAAEFPRAFEELVSHCDEPAADVASMAQWALYRHCREAGFKVVLSGIGGDELFFGYPGWNAIGEQMATTAGSTLRTSPALARIGSLTERRLPALAMLGGHRWPGPWSGLSGHPTAWVNEYALGWMGKEPLRTAAVGAGARVCELQLGAPAGPDSIYSFLARAYLPNNGFQLSDKLGMGNSVEVRVPFADHLLVERVSALPLARRFESGNAKALLKRSLTGLLSREILDRPKRGFTPPGAFIRTIIEANAERVLENPWLSTLMRRDRLAAAIRAYLEATASDTPRSLVARGRGRFSTHGLAPRALEWWLYALVASTRAVETWA
jgi:asparagine synthase (glutamine-hydrolysing)